ncbi:hypothetical protein GE21DRAFT_1078877 [Neurospora crassa]|nr:hypothetical protein GE21DRAFT_1078877 [Neurospora crassa]
MSMPPCNSLSSPGRRQKEITAQMIIAHHWHAVQNQVSAVWAHLASLGCSGWFGNTIDSVASIDSRALDLSWWRHPKTWLGAAVSKGFFGERGKASVESSVCMGIGQVQPLSPIRQCMLPSGKWTDRCNLESRIRSDLSVLHMTKRGASCIP